jgi:hypothetical protein
MHWQVCWKQKKEAGSLRKSIPRKDEEDIKPIEQEIKPQIPIRNDDVKLHNANNSNESPIGLLIDLIYLSTFSKSYSSYSKCFIIVFLKALS